MGRRSGRCRPAARNRTHNASPLPGISLPLRPPTRADEKRTRLILSAAEDKNIEKLRHLAVEGGLVSLKCRQVAWPLLIGIDGPPRHIPPGTFYKHKERMQMELDIARGMWLVPDRHRDNSRESLLRVMLAALTSWGEIPPEQETYYYYQGLHDLASVLVLVLGEDMAATVLSRLLRWHLSLFVSRSFANTEKCIVLITHLIRVADPELGGVLDDCLGTVGINGNFALSWVLTWFSHTYRFHLDACCRIVDTILASHPTMILYICAVAAQSNREEVLRLYHAGELDHAVCHSMLGRLPDDPPVEEWIVNACNLMSRFPPEKLAAHHPGFKCTPFAVSPDAPDLEEALAQAVPVVEDDGPCTTASPKLRREVLLRVSTSLVAVGLLYFWQHAASTWDG